MSSTCSCLPATLLGCGPLPARSRNADSVSHRRVVGEAAPPVALQRSGPRDDLALRPMLTPWQMRSKASPG